MLQDKSTISIQPITLENIQHLRKLNAVLLPVNYNDKFYNDLIVTNDKQLSCLGNTKLTAFIYSSKPLLSSIDNSR